MKRYKYLVNGVLFALSLVLITSFAVADSKVNSDFRIAAGMGQMDRVHALLKQGADINSGGPSSGSVPGGGTALMLAATRNHPEMVGFLISQGADVNQSDNGGGTALIYAVWKGYRDIVAFLLDHNADVYAKTRDGRTPLSVAKQAGHTDIAKMLKAKAMQ